MSIAMVTCHGTEIKGWTCYKLESIQMDKILSTITPRQEHNAKESASSIAALAIYVYKSMLSLPSLAHMLSVLC